MRLHGSYQYFTTIQPWHTNQKTPCINECHKDMNGRQCEKTLLNMLRHVENVRKEDRQERTIAKEQSRLWISSKDGDSHSRTTPSDRKRQQIYSSCHGLFFEMARG